MKKPIAITLMLLWALYPENPYGYYIFLKLCCCSYFGFMAWKNKSWVLIGLALLYNPFIPVWFSREIWSILNILTIIIMWGCVRKPIDC